MIDDNDQMKQRLRMTLYRLDLTFSQMPKVTMIRNCYGKLIEIVWTFE